MSTTMTEQLKKGLEDVVAGSTSICTISPDTETLLYRGYSAVIFLKKLHLKKLYIYL